MRILGIDPGLRVTGFGVIDVSGHRLAYVTSGVIRTPTADLPPGSARSSRRLDHRARTRPRPGRDRKGVRQREPAVDAAAPARRGAAICGLVAGGLPVAEYTALQLKQAVVGYPPRDQDADAGNGHAAAQPLRPTRPTRPTRSAWRSATRTAARSARWRRAGARGARGAGWSADGGAHRGPARRLDCVGHLGCADHLDRFTRARRAAPCIAPA